MPVAEILSRTPSKTKEKPPVYALVGNPNSGKTTLFNALTGMRQKVGNYPGVTVEKKQGTCFSQHGKELSLIDLPGCYSLSAHSPDEAITQEVLLGTRRDTQLPDCVICLVDASNLERNLFLATHVLELGIPVVIALNMMDVARKKGQTIDVERLEKRLGAPVVPCEAHNGKGIIELRLVMSRSDLKPSPFRCGNPPKFQEAVLSLLRSMEAQQSMGAGHAYLQAYLLLNEGMADALPGAKPVPPEILEEARELRDRLDKESPGWRSELVAERYKKITEICREALRTRDLQSKSATETIDSLLLHPALGWVALLSIMGLLFFSIFSLAETPMNWVDAVVALVSGQVESWMAPGEFRNLLVDGVIAGVGSVVIFLPQILLLFFFIGLLESTGYMARAAFILDRLMSKVGLHGRSFIPLLSSYACAVPGVMATRTIESPKDRLATIMVAPFMTCSARLPVYLVMIAALAPAESVSAWQKAGLLLAMYFLGTATAFVFAGLFKKTLLRGETLTPIMELPPYRWPAFKYVLMEMFDRSRIFLKRAGTIILGLSILLWFAMTYPKVESGGEGEQLRNSFAGRVGHAIEPVFRPLGYDWKIDIGVLASFAAREVFVSTMAIIYNVDGADDENVDTLVETLRSQKKSDGTPVFTPLTCLSLMIFYVYALQCISTIAIVKRETNSWRWPLFQLFYMTAFAYLAALAVYQGGRLMGWN